MQLSIIIINFNTVQLTIDCIKSLKENTRNLSYEIIVVDNAPKQDYEEAFLSYFPEIKYVRSSENIGFGRANNLGMQMAAGDYFLLLNSDTIIFDDAIGSCLSYLQSPEAQNIGMLGCKLLNEDGSYQPSFYPYRGNSLWSYMKSNNPVLYKLCKVGDDYKENPQIRPVGDISGAFMLLRKDVFETTRGFDPDFFLYCEETEWCRNRIEPCYQIVYYPKLAIVHLGGKSAPKAMMQVQSQVSLGLYWYKTGILKYIAFLLFTLLNSLFYLLLFPIAGSKGRSELRNNLGATRKAIPYWLFRIPTASRRYAARPEGIIYEGAREIFFGKKTERPAEAL